MDRTEITQPLGQPSEKAKAKIDGWDASRTESRYAMTMGTSYGFSSTQARVQGWCPIGGFKANSGNGSEGLDTLEACTNAIEPRETQVGVVKGIPAVLHDFGLVPGEVIKSGAVDPHVFDNPRNLLPLATLGRLLDHCVRSAGCTHFGLLVGSKADASSFGLIGELMQNSPSLAAALGQLVGCTHFYDRAAAPSLEVTGGVAVLSYAGHPSGLAGADQLLDAEFAAAFGMMKILCGPAWSPVEVLLPRVSLSDASPFRQYFKAPVRLRQEQAAIVFEARWLNQSIENADAALHEIAQLKLKQLMQADNEPFSSQLRRTLRTTLLRKGLSARRTASLFAMHRRTMSRKLEAEGLTFQQLLDEVRYDVARQLIRHAHIPLAEVAGALGYSEASALTRAFRRWSGLTPGAWRLANPDRP